MSIDVLTDFAYGMLMENRDEKERKQVDELLARVVEAAQPSAPVRVPRADGSVVYITEARLAQIRRNMGGMGRISRGKRKEKQR